MKKSNSNIPDNFNTAKYAFHLNALKDCRICPRNCGVNRFSNQLGYCNSDATYYISSICLHHGEEPPISGPDGICNVFFGHCNLQCNFCQNYQISNNKDGQAARRWDFEDVINKIIHFINQGSKGLGFVSPSHFVPQIKAIVHALHDLKRNPFVVYNTNGYDKTSTLHGLEDLVDVWLPDFKYIDADIAKRYSEAQNYPEIAKKALKEMYRQKGSSLITDENGVAERGIIIRHLVLPGHVENSLQVLRFIAEEISSSIHISLMSQYHPTFAVQNISPLNRTLYRDEYERVVDEFHKLGFRNGFIQDMDSFESYRPDFDKEHPFES